MPHVTRRDFARLSGAALASTALASRPRPSCIRSLRSPSECEALSNEKRQPARESGFPQGAEWYHNQRSNTLRETASTPGVGLKTYSRAAD